MIVTDNEGVERKLSCRTCIKGHRSTKCSHVGRELFEIKPKGRPISQCKSCRELRKRKHVHIKCNCINRHMEGSKSPAATTVTTDGAVHDKQSDASTEHMHEHGDMLHKRCLRCERHQGACICTYDSNMRKAQESDSSSSTTSEDTSTPSSNASDNSYNTLPPLRLAPSQEKPLIPIHDPTDDINSDTPLYKPDLAPDREAVLGQLSHRSSEDLLEEIYSDFMGPPNKRRRCKGSPGESYSQQSDDPHQEPDPL